MALTNSNKSGERGPKPAGYGPTDSAEIESINIFRCVLDPDRVKANLNERDRHPNIDGYLELVNDDGTPVGKLEVQVRTIPDGSTRYQCRTSLFAYTLSTALPVLLICVDIKNRSVYWKHIKYEEITGKEEQASVSIHFQIPTDLVSRTSSVYNAWLRIARDYIDRVRRSSALQTVAKATTPLMESAPRAIKCIQLFLDELNSMLSGSFSCVKSAFFPGAWKVGLGLHLWKENQLQYALFPVKSGEEPLIKQLPIAIDIFRDPDIGFYSYSGQNKIAQDPKKEAKHFVHRQVKELIAHQGLSLRVDFLCSEFMFGFIEEHLECLGLDEADSYVAEELNHAFLEYFPRWCNLARREVTDYPAHIPYLDPGILLMSLTKSLKNEVEESIARSEPLPAMAISSSRFSYRQLFDLVDFIKSTSKTIRRIYKRRRSSGAAGYVWSGFSYDDVLFNIKVLHERMPEVYNQLLEVNEMDYSVLRPYPDVSRVVMFPSPWNDTLKDPPTINRYGLVSEGLHSTEALVSVVEEAEIQSVRAPSGQMTATFRGNRYRVRWHGESTGLYLFEHTPMLSLIYRILVRRLDETLGGG